MENNRRYEVVLIQGEEEKKQPIWSFVKEHKKLLLIFLVIGVVAGIGAAIFYMTRPTTPTQDVIVPPPTVSLLANIDMDFLTTKLADQQINTLSIGKRIDQEAIQLTSEMHKLLLSFESDRSVLPYKIQQLKTLLDSAKQLAYNASSQAWQYPVLLVDVDLIEIQALLATNVMEIDALRQEIARDSEYINYSGMRLRMMHLESLNNDLNKILSGQASSLPVNFAAQALQRDIDDGIALVDDVKEELYSIIRNLAEEENENMTAASVITAAPKPSMVRAIAVFAVIFVGISVLGIIVALVKDQTAKQSKQEDE